VCKSQERVLAKVEGKLNASFVVAMLDVLIIYYFIFIFIITLFIVMSESPHCYEHSESEVQKYST